MRHSLLAPAVALLFSVFQSPAQEPFSGSSTLSFTEEVTQVVRLIEGEAGDPDDDYYDDQIFEGRLQINAAIPLSGLSPAAFNSETPLFIEVGDFILDTTFAGGDPEQDYIGAGVIDAARQTLTLPLYADDQITYEIVRVGELTLSWTLTELILRVDVKNAAQFYSAFAQNSAAGIEGTFADEEVASTIQIGDRILEGRTVFVNGTAELYSVTVGAGALRETFEDLARVKVGGAFDTKPPSVMVTNPPTGTNKSNPVTQDPLTVTGSVTDEHGVESVAVDVNGRGYVPAVLDESGGWSLAGVSLDRGNNTIRVQATDSEGNVVTSSPLDTYFAVLTAVTVSATGTGSGAVSGSFFSRLSYSPGNPVSEAVTVQQEGDRLVVTATPALPGSVFAGWTSNVALTDAQRASPQLEFIVQPNQVVTASFAPNPFLDKGGSYHGLVQSPDPNARGFLSLKLTATGAFTGTFRTGKFAAPFKGTLLADGSFRGQIKSRARIWDLSLQLSTNPDGSVQFLGSVNASSDVNSIVTLDRATFRKRVNEPEQKGSYNVLLPPAESNADARYPAGIGYGRVTISGSGMVRFAGQLADGTAIASAAPLSAEGTWPIYAALYGKTGSVSGRVTFDLGHADHDLVGSLDWFKPAAYGVGSGGPHGDGFSGVSAVVGARFSKPVPGQRLFLFPESSGAFSIEAPAAVTSNGVSLPEFATGTSDSQPDPLALLDATNRLTVVDAALAARVRINASTGVLKGTFVDPTQGASVRFGGVIVAPKVNAAGGFFVRGNRSGAVQVTPTSPPAE